ncbi:glutamate ABC transporter substrate-binding protein [Nocardia sp. CDC159]|uniref:Glutamate ABC transporter substrate-binding protein n=1 Tax=Nocardia pulmonis TaxID=2951408 RepID=A0A9X2E2K3_9NOCA|nr:MULTISPECIES: glutamate ABC transporter substrate-binding protein [Nocardia]MCM6773097.1 glutamate ABC transporter substrate-binding protein [Nocardia pulmonis]MCM6785600.1 glutamate ABC transporter substrate-binding protein [Nocardia sp. CDC159]
MSGGRALRVLAMVAIAWLSAGCGADPRVPSTPSTVAVWPAPPKAAEITAAPAAADGCDAEVSLRPGAPPRPGAMPPDSPMARIVAKGRITVGVDQNTYLFGFRDPATGQLRGFDIDLAREIARDLFGDPNRIELRSVSSAERVRALQDHQVDLVVRTFSSTCDRRRDIDFSAVYYSAAQRILTGDPAVRSKADLGGKRVCVTFGSTSARPLFELPARPTVRGVDNWTDCLVQLQQGQVDAVSTDEPILAGLAQQDRNLRVVGDALGRENYAVGVPKGEPELVRFVNGVLERVRADGTWQRLYNEHLGILGPSPGPPPPRYSD